ncbi:hypothetical protein GS489_06180 [Rhodococcus hoagii]|nr:hypothetical protein [Prescottella equi]
MLYPGDESSNTSCDAKSIGAESWLAGSVLGNALRGVAACRSEGELALVETHGTGWEYGSLATLAYELDKPIGTSFGDVEFYLSRLQGVTCPVLEPAVGTGESSSPSGTRILRARVRQLARDLDQCRATVHAMIWSPTS